MSADAGDPATAPLRAGAAVIVPTFREAANAPELLRRIGAVQAERPDLGLQLIIVDDDSRDGIGEIVAAAAAEWARVIVRRGVRGLGSAVIRGFAEAGNAASIVVMDADLTHPPERIPDLLNALARGAEIAVGSRRADGATVDTAWPASRRAFSRAATLLARPLTHVRDPLSGFFAIRRETLDRCGPLKGSGFKILLEVLAKSRCGRGAVVEVPIHFADRAGGESKLGAKQALQFARQAAGLYAGAVKRAIRA